MSHLLSLCHTQKQYFCLTSYLSSLTMMAQPHQSVSLNTQLETKFQYSPAFGYLPIISGVNHIVRTQIRSAVRTFYQLSHCSSKVPRTLAPPKIGKEGPQLIILKRSLKIRGLEQMGVIPRLETKPSISGHLQQQMVQTVMSNAIYMQPIRCNAISQEQVQPWLSDLT